MKTSTRPGPLDVTWTCLLRSIPVSCVCSAADPFEVFRFGECFAGTANVTFAMKMSGFPAFKLDRDYYAGRCQDFLTPPGYGWLGCSELCPCRGYV